MPYTPPGSTLVAAPAHTPSSPVLQRSPSADRNHHRARSFTDEQGPGAFTPIVGLPRRSNHSRPPTPKFSIPIVPVAGPSSTSAPSPSKPAPKFNIHGGSGSSDDTDDDDDGQEVALPLPDKAPAPPADDDDDEPSYARSALASRVAIAASSNAAAPSPPPEQIPFPTLKTPTSIPSPVVTAATPITRSTSTPQIQSPSMESAPSIYRSPYSSLRSEPGTRNRMPLKPALKSNHSSPHLPSLTHQRSLTQSAPSTPHLTPSWSNGNSPSPSAPGSPGSVYSVPQTPKQVHFASEKAHLESVVVFTKGTRPRSLSNPGGNDTETETEGYDSSGPSWNRGGRYPFPIMPKDQDVPQLDESRSTQVPFKSAIGGNGYFPNGERQWVVLETVNLPGTRPPMLRGSVLVRNVAFQKRVAVRFTLDDWQTTSEVSCNYSASLPAIPPPFASHAHGLSAGGGFGHSKSASTSVLLPSPAGSSSSLNQPLSNGKGDAWDRFTFSIKLEDVERSLPNKKIFLVVRYQLPSQWGWECGGEWWDNNETRNYQFAFKVGKKATTLASSSTAGSGQEISPSALSARLAASIPRQQQQEPSSLRTQSLPPLPPPGPVKSSSVVSLSPSSSSSALGLKINKPVLPPLATSGPVKLRSGRGPTFAEVSPRPSPPGSPTLRGSPTRAATMYQPPLPGSVPGATFGLPERDHPHSGSKEKLTITTTDLLPPSSSASSSPTIGKKKGLSLSNYVSPTSVKSPSSNALSSAANLSSLLGGDGGENHYVYHRKESSNTSTSSNGPMTPGGELNLVGGMPATFFVEPGAYTPPSSRTSSWDVPLKGLWNSMSGKPNAPAAAEEQPKKDAQDQQPPTPPDSISSNLSTPDLERSPEQVDAPALPDRDTPTPTMPPTVETSTVPFPTARSSPPSPSVTARPAVFSPLILTPNDSDADEDPEQQQAQSGLHSRRLQRGDSGSSTSGGAGAPMMKLEMPARPMFQERERNGSDSSNSSSSSSSAGRRPKTTRRTTEPPAILSPPPAGAAGGPPAEFLAKYCFFVSSPAASPPSAAPSPPLIGALGVETPRASSPGLASAAAAWWGYSNGTGSPPKEAS